MGPFPHAIAQLGQSARRLRWLGPVSLAAAFAIGCGAAVEESDPDLEIAQTQQSVLGDFTVEDSCEPDVREFLERSMSEVRATVQTNALAECIADFWQNGFAGGVYGTDGVGTYKPCVTDPGAGMGMNVRYAMFMQVAASANDVSIECANVGANADALIESWNNSDTEHLRVNAWIDENGQPQGLTYIMMGDDNTARQASIIFHEIMHQQGYDHGDGTAAENKEYCGYASDPDWHYQENTAPYIGDACVKYTIRRGRDLCGGQGCATYAIPMADGHQSTGCECAIDERHPSYVGAIAAYL
jgi:hypothetical protein